MGHTVIIKLERTLIPDWEDERRKMVDAQLRKRGIRDTRVLSAMLEIPRETFVPAEECRVLSYTDAPVPIGCGQTISQPYMTAIMAEVLELRGNETVLEVGAGCGYAAAVLGALAERVVAMEIIPGLARLARENLLRTGRHRNVTIVEGDGSAGCGNLGPYDAISVAAGAPEIPAALLGQLKDSGRLVIPVGTRQDQKLRLVTRRNGEVHSRTVTQCRFVPLRGGEGWK